VSRSGAVIAALVALSLLSVDTAAAGWFNDLFKSPAKPAASPPPVSKPVPKPETSKPELAKPEISKPQTPKAESKPATATCERSKFPIIIDVGHTALSTGAMSARNVAEFDFNLRLAKRIEEKLKSEGFTEASLMVTEGKAKASLAKRVAAANRSNAKLFLSIHHDSVPDRLLEDWEFEGAKRHFSDRFTGYSLFVSTRNPLYEASLKFGKLIGAQLKAQGLDYAHQYTQPIMGKYRRKLLDKEVGVYLYENLRVLGWTRMPAVLLEAGSIINRDEELVMNSPERQDILSAAVAEAVKQFCEVR